MKRFGLTILLLVTLAAIIWSASAVAGKSLVMKYNIIAILAWRFGFAALFLYLSLVVIPEPVNLPALLAEQGLLSALYLGIVINAVGFAFYYYGLKRLPIRVVAFIELLYPLFGILIPMWSRGGSVGVLHVFGSVTLLLSIGLLLHLEYPRPRKAG